MSSYKILMGSKGFSASGSGICRLSSASHTAAKPKLWSCCMGDISIVGPSSSHFTDIGEKRPLSSALKLTSLVVMGDGSDDARLYFDVGLNIGAAPPAAQRCGVNDVTWPRDDDDELCVVVAALEYRPAAVPVLL